VAINGTAGYGTLRLVVWEDGGGDPASYPIPFPSTRLKPPFLPDKCLTNGGIVDRWWDFWSAPVRLCDDRLKTILMALLAPVLEVFKQLENNQPKE